MSERIARVFGYGTSGGCVRGPNSEVKRETVYRPPDVDMQKSCEECDEPIDSPLDACINEECSEFFLN